MEKEYVKIPEEAFNTLLYLLDDIIEHLPSMPGHERKVMYEKLDEIKECVFKEDDE